MLFVRGESTALSTEPHSTADGASGQTRGLRFARSPRLRSFGPAGRRSTGSSDWLRLKESLPRRFWFQFQFRPIVGGGPACGAPSVGNRQVSPGARGPLVAPGFRRPQQGGEPQRSLRVAGPRGSRAWRLEWHPRWSPPRSLSPSPRPPPGGAPGPRRVD